LTACIYHTIYRVCCNCGRDMGRHEKRECVAPNVPTLFSTEGERTARITALLEARALIVRVARDTTLPSIGDVLTEFDRVFPETRR